MGTQSQNPPKRIYEKPKIVRHAVIMTMAPAGSKMGHGVFPFVSQVKRVSSKNPKEVYRR